MPEAGTTVASHLPVPLKRYRSRLPSGYGGKESQDPTMGGDPGGVAEEPSSRGPGGLETAAGEKGYQQEECDDGQGEREGSHAGEVHPHRDRPVSRGFWC